MAYISFNDGEVRVVRSIAPAPGDRFDGWTPTPVVIGPRHAALGSGIPYVVEHRTDYRVAFSINQIRPADIANAIKLIRWLGLGGVATFYTEDLSGRVYTAYVAEDTEPPQLTPPDDEYLHNLQGVVLISGSPYVPICSYVPPDAPSVEVGYDPGYPLTSLTFTRTSVASYISGP